MAPIELDPEVKKKRETFQRLSIVICGHVDAGKSTTTGRLIFELGGLDEREMEKLKKEAETLGKASFAFAFFMDRQKEERERGVTIACTTKDFYTESKWYTIIDAPGHRDFIKNMISGASQADVALLMVPADGNFAVALAAGNHKAGEVIGQTRQHALLLKLLGCKQLIIGVNKMDCNSANYENKRYVECRDEAIHMLGKVGWKGDLDANNIPIIPISGWMGDNLTKKSQKMAWWTGVDVMQPGDGGVSVHIETLVDALEKFVRPPTRKLDCNIRVPLSGVYTIQGVGLVVTGRVEQGKVQTNAEDKKTVIFLPAHTAANPCKGKIFTIEMHHATHKEALPGDNVGMNIKLADKNMPAPQTGDIMVWENDDTIGICQTFTATVQVQSHPNELKVGYCPIAFCRTNHVAVKMTKIVKSKRGKNPWVDEPLSIKAGDAAIVEFEPQQPFVVEKFENCEGLGRIAIMDGGSVVMLGRVNDVVHRAADAANVKGAKPAKK